MLSRRIRILVPLGKYGRSNLVFLGSDGLVKAIYGALVKLAKNYDMKGTSKSNGSSIRQKI